MRILVSTNDLVVEHRYNIYISLYIPYWSMKCKCNIIFIIHKYIKYNLSPFDSQTHFQFSHIHTRNLIYNHLKELTTHNRDLDRHKNI